MNSICKTALGLALVSTVPACGQSASKNDAVTDQNVQITGSESTSTSTGSAFDPAERKMGDQMMAMQQAMVGAQSPTISETYMRKMLAHHEGAIAMSNIALNSGVSGAIKMQVEKTKAGQQKEADTVKSMIRKSSS